MRPTPTMLRGLPPFRDLPDALLAEIETISDVVTVEHGQEVCRQGAVPTHLYYVLEGQISLSSTAPDGTTAVVEVIHPLGDFVLASVMLRLPYLQAANAVTRGRLVAIEAEALGALIERSPALSLALLLSLSRDFRNLVRQVRDLKVRTTAQRLGCYLLALVPDPTVSEAAIRLPFEKGLLAGRLGCRQENLSRAFAALRELGVETHGARVTLRDVPRLTAYAMPDYLNDPELASLAAASIDERVIA
ncbi:MAG: cyclic nucleotide-binding domain-containing protein [Acetobacteraceae bacterium]